MMVGWNCEWGKGYFGLGFANNSVYTIKQLVGKLSYPEPPQHKHTHPQDIWPIKKNPKLNF